MVARVPGSRCGTAKGIALDTKAVSKSVVLLDAWLQSMRSVAGYTGPVSHWWESCLLYSGAKIDWRYEGIICGYVNLFQKTHDPRWLERAVTAGDDICASQLPSGQFRNSSFQQGPIEGGTPHEAAVCVGLLELARLLRSRDDARWLQYYAAAERNIREYLLGCLWNGRAFLDQPWNTTLVPNKNATTLEALLLYEELSGNSMEQYIEGAASLIISAQIAQMAPYQGATIHLGTGAHRLAIGIYTARCAAALVRLYQSRGQDKYLQSARAMGAFLVASTTDVGTIFGFYPDGRKIVCPTWISPSGDLLRALLDLQPYMEISAAVVDRLVDALLAGQSSAGGIATAYGLGRKGSTKQFSGKPDFRDVLPVAGWCDKAFRALTMLVQHNQPVDLSSAKSMFGDTSIPCIWKGRQCHYQETATELSVRDQRGKILYSWRKGSCYPTVFQI